MPLMKWDPKYSVGVQKFDHDHQHLFSMINDLNDATQAHKGKAAVGEALAGLVAYTLQHIASEEAAMKRTDYPGYAVHAEEHRRLTERVHAFLRDYELGNALISIDLLMFLRDWLDKHVLQSDREYGAHLNAHGVS